MCYGLHFECQQRAEILFQIHFTCFRATQRCCLWYSIKVKWLQQSKNIRQTHSSNNLTNLLSLCGTRVAYNMKRKAQLKQITATKHAAKWTKLCKKDDVLADCIDTSISSKKKKVWLTNADHLNRKLARWFFVWVNLSMTLLLKSTSPWTNGFSMESMERAFSLCCPIVFLVNVLILLCGAKRFISNLSSNDNVLNCTLNN